MHTPVHTCDSRAMAAFNTQAAKARALGL